MRAIRRARLFGVLVFVVLMVVLAAWYFTFTSERQQYLVSRNARLTTIATQVDNTIAAQERMFATFLRSAPACSGSPREPKGSALAQSRGHEPAAARSPPRGLHADELRLNRGPQRVAAVVVHGQCPTRPWPTRSEARLGRPARADLAQQSDHAFDTLVLASSDGRVLHAVGAQSADLMLTRLDQLQPVQTRRFVIGPTRAESTPVFKSSGASTGLLDAEISGSVHNYSRSRAAS